MKLNLHNFFKEPDFRYDSLNKCYYGTKNNLNVSFNFNIEERNKYFFTIEYNSINKPPMILKLNNKIVSYNLLHTNTRTLDRHLSFRYEYGPNVYKGIVNFELICNGGFPHIYSIEMVKCSDSFNHISTISSYNVNDFVLINSYNIYGGFFWHLNNYLICSYFCEIYNKIPIVNFNSSLFLNNTDIENKLVMENTNWFFNYFESYKNIPYTIYNSLINYNNTININEKLLPTINKINKDKLLLFNKESFLLFAPKFHSNINNSERIISKYFKFLPHITDKINQIKRILYPNNYYITPHLYKFIGVHYRGTDKIIENNATEHYPKHYKYQTVLDLINNKIKSLKNYNVYIIISTDEQPFIDFMFKHLDKKIIFYENSFRSNINTENINTDFTNIPTRNVKYNYNLLDPITKKKFLLRESLVNNSIHLGNKHVSNYKKGYDCLIDSLLLSDCNILYKSTGNFSMFCKLFNKKIDDLEVIQLNNI